MTKRCATLLFAVLAFSAALRAQDMHPGPGTTASIVSAPTDAEVWLGDSLLGRTPLQVRGGITDTLILYYPARAAWRKARALAIPPFPPSGQGVVSVVLREWRRVTSTPSGAAVFAGDSLLGYTPLEVDPAAVPPVLQLRSPGWRDSAAVLSVVDEGCVHVLLARAEGPALPDVLIDPSAARLPSASILVAGSVTLAAGVAAVVLRQQADRHYDEYVRSGDRALLDKTRRGDLLSGVCLAVMEASAGYLVYLLLNGL